MGTPPSTDREPEAARPSLRGRHRERRGGHPRAALAISAVALILVGVGLAAHGLTRPGPADPEPALTPQGSGARGTLTYEHADQLSGTWSLASDGQSFVGYRIYQQYKGLPSSETVTGRTTAIRARMRISERAVRAVAVEADLTKLQSSDAERDDALRTRGLETDKHPLAIFALSTEINLGSMPPANGDATSLVLGDLRLHGTVKPVEVDLKARIIPGDPPLIEVVGTEALNLRDFGIEPPDVAGLLEVNDQGAFEFKLRFVHD